LKKSSVVNPFPVLPNVERETGGSTNKKKTRHLNILDDFHAERKIFIKKSLKQIIFSRWFMRHIRVFILYLIFLSR
jgi:hypothetical protein